MLQYCIYYLFGLICMSGFHEEHYSVTNIDYRNNSDSLYISIKLNAHDLDFALAHNYKNLQEINTSSNKLEINQYIEKYISSTITFRINQVQILPYKCKNIKVVNNDIWLYITLPVKEGLKELEVMQALFFDIYTDQVNLVIISCNGKERGFKTTFYERNLKYKTNSADNE